MDGSRFSRLARGASRLRAAAQQVGQGTVAAGQGGAGGPVSIAVPAGDSAALIAAIEKANCGGVSTIVLAAASTYVLNKSYRGDLALPPIERPFTIEGRGAALKIAVARHANLGYTSISESGELTVRNVSFADAHVFGSDGAVAHIAGKLTAEDVTFHGNAVFASDDGAVVSDRSGEGGALFIMEGATVVLTRCTFTNNQAASGAAILNQGSLTVSGCTFANNSAVHGAGGIAIDLATRPTVVTDSHFENNCAGAISVYEVFKSYFTEQRNTYDKNRPGNIITLEGNRS